MPMQERFTYLLNQYYNRQSSPEELEEFYLLIDSHQYDDEIRDFMNEVYAQDTLSSTEGSATEYFPPGAELRMLQHVLQSKNDQAEHAIPPSYANVRRLWPRITAAASILLLFTVGGYFLLHKSKNTRQVAQIEHDVAPGSNKAVLKMASGQLLVVTDAKNGLLAKSGTTTITKAADGKLVYSSSGVSNGTMLYDTLIVPRGGQHRIKFSDGSIAFLNADTKLRFPENFDKSDRTVELISGEADFQVVHNAKSPFRVKVRNQMTEDIGTEFNISAYTDEPAVKTTLLTGKVKISNTITSSNLKPGEQSAVTASDKIKIYQVDTDEAFAWKNGKFLFSSTSLDDIMKQLSRWYDVDVAYQDVALKKKHFSAISTRFANASQVLNNLELTGEVKFKIEGKKITVLNR